MIRLNKKGFTLIELLAVVVILLAISVIAVSSISAAIERNKVKQNDAKKEVLVDYARIYYGDRKNTLEKTVNGSGIGCIELDDLFDVGMSEEEMKDTDGEYFSGKIKFYSGGSNFEYVNTCP